MQLIATFAHRRRFSCMVNDLNIAVEIRPATQDDVDFVAWTVLTALDMDSGHAGLVRRVCADPESLYSWTNAIIATVDGHPAGCLIAYPGDRYLDMRRHTWPRLWVDLDAEVIHNSAIETGPGEFYLDSLAVLPQYRGQLRIGARLIDYDIALAWARGYDSVTILGSDHKPRLQAYYESLGFMPYTTMDFLGHRYHKLRLRDNG